MSEDHVSTRSPAKRPLEDAASATAVLRKVERIDLSFRHCADGTVDAFVKIDYTHKASAIGRASALEAAKAALEALLSDTK